MLHSTLDTQTCWGTSQGKWVKVTAKGKGKVSVQQHTLDSKGLAAYLALPVEQYSLLDPTWIERQVSACACALDWFGCPGCV